MEEIEEKGENWKTQGEIAVEKERTSREWEQQEAINRERVVVVVVFILLVTGVKQSKLLVLRLKSGLWTWVWQKLSSLAPACSKY